MRTSVRSSLSSYLDSAVRRLTFCGVAAGIVLSFIPPGDTSSKVLFETKLIAGTGLSILLGLVLSI